jgi:2-polyprenyl-3-methyl-5-hydroxy-6-metoxy-1,4-benzoquinol methylase/glycosyltransferase involved in cell wall biosynthesis
MVSTVFNTKDIKRFLLAARTGDRSDIASFLRNFKEGIKSYREHLPLEITPLSLVHSISRAREITGKDDLMYLAHGMEGVILTDGINAYKYFHKGVLTFKSGQLDFIRESMLGRNFRHFVNLKDVYQESREVVFCMELFHGEPYNGGRLSSIRSFLRDCRENNLAYRNMHPKNIIVCGDEFKICDLGRSNVPFTDKEFREMAKRSYLMYRYHFREDLPELMNIALFTEDIPELYGFDHFWNSLEDKAKYELVDSLVIDIVNKSGGKEVLDYGCGRGGIAESLSNMDFSVTGFDIDDDVIQKNVVRDTDITYLGSSDLDPLLSSGKQFDVVVCSLVVCIISDKNELYTVLENLRSLVKEEGRVVFALCNPFNTFVNETGTRITHLKEGASYSDIFSYDKIAKETSRTRFEVHRPFHTIKRMIECSGFVVSDVHESEGVDFDSLAPASDFLVLELEPVRLSLKCDVSLLIKANPIEWKTIDFQIEHIVSQLNSPRRFSEVVVVTGLHEAHFLKQSDKPDIDRLKEKLDMLKEKGVIDKVVYVPDNPKFVRQTYMKWFGIGCSETHASNGQHTFTSLYGLEQCKGDYVLQMDSDCIVVRLDSNHDYLEDMIEVFNRDPDALTVSFNVARLKSSPYSHSDGKMPWRTEVRFSLFDRRRLDKALPLQNKINKEGVLVFPWHWSMDQLVRNSRWKSYRGGDNRTFFIHVPNDVKHNANRWYNIVKEAEKGHVPPVQFGYVDFRGSITDWLSARNEEFVYVLRGRDVSLPKIRRVLDSIYAQSYSGWGMVIIDAGSTNGDEDYFENFVVPKYRDRATFWRNWTPIKPIENTIIAIKELCNNPDSVIITLDSDNSLIGNNVLDRLKSFYDGGADLTVGSMLRTDKHREYPVDFNTPRENRGGNVWQHLRTFKKRLFDSIPEDYFKIDGEWVPHTEDWAFMLPMVDIAKKPVHIKDYLYFYEPLEDKSTRSITEREAIITEIIGKPKMVVTN